MLVCLGKSSFVKSFINSIVIVRFLVSPADKMSPSETSLPSLSVTLNVRYLCCSLVNTVFSILSILAFIVPLFTKSTVYVTLSPCIHCAKLLVQSEVSRVVYLNNYKSDAGIKLLEECGIIVDKLNMD